MAHDNRGHAERWAHAEDLDCRVLSVLTVPIYRPWRPLRETTLRSLPPSSISSRANDERGAGPDTSIALRFTEAELDTICGAALDIRLFDDLRMGLVLRCQGKVARRLEATGLVDTARL